MYRNEESDRTILLECIIPMKGGEEYKLRVRRTQFSIINLQLATHLFGNLHSQSPSRVFLHH